MINLKPGDYVEKATNEADHDAVVKRMVECGNVRSGENDIWSDGDDLYWNGLIIKLSDISWSKPTHTEIKRRFTVDQVLGRDDGESVVKWNGEGLPPVGAVCELSFPHSQDNGREIRVIAYNNADIIYDIKGHTSVLKYGLCEFRQIKTERERFLENAKKHCAYPGSWMTTYRDFAEALFDVGYKEP